MNLKMIKMEILNYIDFGSICEDYELKYGDLSPEQTMQLEEILNEFIKQNK